MTTISQLFPPAVPLGMVHLLELEGTGDDTITIYFYIGWPDVGKRLGEDERASPTM